MKYSKAEPLPDDVLIPEPELLAVHIPWQARSNIQAAKKKSKPGQVLKIPKFGGRITMCVFLRGKFPEMHHKCLDSIIKTTPRDMVDLRIAAVGVDKTTLEYLQELPISVCYLHNVDKGKYTVMREMFWDDKNPIRTSYIVWMDGTAFVNHSDWVNLIAKTVGKQKDDVALFGSRMGYSISANRQRDPRLWFQDSEWHKGKDFRTSRGTPAPNGDTVHFVADWFWVLRTDVMKQCGIPDVRITEKGGDVAMGEQIYQAGYQTMEVNAAKSLVYRPSGTYGHRDTRKDVYPWA